MSMVVSHLLGRRHKGGAYFGNNPYVLAKAWWESSSLIFGIGKVVEATGVEGLLKVFEVEGLACISVAASL